MLSSMVARNERTVQDIRRWVSANRPLDTLKAFPSKYDLTERIRECEEEISKLKESETVANERVGKAKEAYMKRKDETTRLMLEMELLHANEISELIKKKDSEYGFLQALRDIAYGAVKAVVSVVISPVVNRLTTVLAEGIKKIL
eukprot:gene11956-13546_t